MNYCSIFQGHRMLSGTLWLPPPEVTSVAYLILLGMSSHLPMKSIVHPHDQWEFQDPKMEVLYHIRPCFVGIFSKKIGLKIVGLIYGIGTSDLGSLNGHWHESQQTKTCFRKVSIVHPAFFAGSIPNGWDLSSISSGLNPHVWDGWPGGLSHTTVSYSIRITSWYPWGIPYAKYIYIYIHIMIPPWFSVKP